MKILITVLALFFFALFLFAFWSLGATLILMLFGVKGVEVYSLYSFILTLYSLFGFLLFTELAGDMEEKQ